MRVGIVCPYDLGRAGGVQQLCVELSQRLPALGAETVLLAPGTHEAGLGPTVTVRANRSSAPISLSLRAVRRLREHLATVDVVHVHEPFVPLVGWAALSLHKPTVATFHADPAPWTRLLYRLMAPGGRWVLGDAVVTAPSEVAAGALPSAWGDVMVISNAIDVESYRIAATRLPNRIAFLGRDDPRKGLDVLLAAWPEIRLRHPEAELVVMGAEGADRDGIVFSGRVSEEEKRATLASAGIFVAPNRGGESFGIVVAEAMAAGCAVVASDIPAFRQVLGEAGVFAPVGDPATLASRVSDLLAAPERIRSLGDAARKAVGRFDWSHVTARYLQAYESAVAHHPTTIQDRKE